MPYERDAICLRLLSLHTHINMKRTFPLFFLILFSCLSIYAQTTWQAVVEMDNRIFASYVYATANMDYFKTNELEDDNPYYFGDSNGQIGAVLVKNDNFQSPTVTLSIEENEIMYRSSITVKIGTENNVYEIFPKISYKYEILRNLDQPIQISLRFQLQYAGYPPNNESLTIWVHPIHDCPFTFIHRSGVKMALDYMYTAFVNENHPAIYNNLIPEMTKTGIISRTTGYLDNNPAAVKRQVLALWAVLRNRGFHYSTITGDIYSKQVYYQHMRTFEECLQTSQANCADGSAMIASVLLRIGIDPILFVTPDHIFLGYYLEPQKFDLAGNPQPRNFTFLETTMMDFNFAPGQVDQETFNQLAEEYGRISMLLYDKDITSFAGATLSAFNSYSEHEAEFNDPTNKTYQFIDVANYRRLGVNPISR
jgi:hypothetical protein